MKISLACFILSGALVSAGHVHNHHIHKRDVVTDYVKQTAVVLQNEHVWVDINGSPVSTSYELVSTSFDIEAPASTASAVVTSAAPVTSAPITSAPVTSAPVTSAPLTSSTALVAVAVTSSAQVSQVSQAPQVSAQVSTPVTTVLTSSPATSAPATTVVPSVATSSAPSSTLAVSHSSAATSAASSSGSGDFSGDATFFTPGLGACGWTNSESDFIAALNAPQFGSTSNGNPNCGKSATLYRNGKSVTVKIVDKCPECSYGSLDLSPAAFDALASESEGRVEITWSWAD